VASGPIIAPLPEIVLGPGYQVVLEAIDPSTGATVAGVVITDATIYAAVPDDSGPPDESSLATWLQATAP
jgi:hypothetical protein